MALRYCLALYNPSQAAHTKEGHPERPARVEAALRGAQAAEAMVDLLQWDGEADLEKVLRVHPQKHLDQVREACTAGSALDADTYTTPGSWHAALTAAGACLEGAKRLAKGERKHAYVLARPPGHHATAEQAMGFCLLNNAAIAAQALVDAGLGPVVVLDHDVHHGNGTQEIFWERGDVAYASFHLHPHYPMTGRQEETGEGEGKGASLNFDMRPGWGDAEASAFVEMCFIPWLRKRGARSLVVSAGFDSHAGDPLGGLELTTGWYGALFSRLASLKVPILATLEGGYVEEHIEASVEAQLRGLQEPSPKPLAWDSVRDEARQGVVALRKLHGIS